MEYFDRCWIFILCFVVFISCKQRTGEDSWVVDKQNSRLQSMVDPHYILMMRVVDEDKASGLPKDQKRYEWITCVIVQDLSHAPRYRIDAGWDGDPYEFSVREETCTPTYVDAQGKSLTLISGNITLGHHQAAAQQLRAEKQKTEHQQGKHYLAAFGFGAAFKAFSKSIRRTIVSLLPPQLVKKPFLTFLAQAALFKAAPTEERHLFSKMAALEFSALKPDASPDPPSLTTRDWVGVGGSFAAGMATAHVLVNTTAQWGPWGALTGYIIVPFVVSVVISTQSNHAREVLQNFHNILEIHDLEDAQDSAEIQNAASSASIPEVSRILGETLLIAGWSAADQLRSYCVPSSNVGTAPTCRPLVIPE